MTEAEAQAIRFVIDHYESRAARPDLEDDYNNLMYSCDECNSRKGDRSPPADARARGYRFFRPDYDIHEDHFELAGQRIESKSNTGYYSIEALDLNRWSLRRLREIRQKLLDNLRAAEAGILALRKFPIDRLPPTVRGRVPLVIRQAEATQVRIMDQVDDLLREYARSPLIDDDLDPGADARARKRSEALKNIEAIYPGVWRGRHTAR